MIGYSKATLHPSKNYGIRHGCSTPDLIVLHYTAMETAKEALEKLCSPGTEVSAHYLVSASGEIFQLVAENRRAWHAGRSYWAQNRDINSRSVGIELDNDGIAPFSFPQIKSLVGLCHDIFKRWSIPVWRVVAHSDIAIGRKVDPGIRFDWCGLAKENIGSWPIPTEIFERSDEVQFLKDAASYGYETNLGLSAVLNAFRLHFRPAAKGALDLTDCSLMHDLAVRFPLTLLIKKHNRV